MNEHDKNFIKNMSPLLIAAMVMFFMLVAYETKADDVVGHSFDGLPVYKSDTEIKGIKVNDIRGSSYNRENNTLNLKLKNKNVEVHFYNNCFELSFMTNLGFKSFSSVSKYNILLRKYEFLKK